MIPPQSLTQKLSPRRLLIRDRLLRDPYCRLQTQDEISVAAELGIQIDVNQASVDDWLRLPGISIHQARSLVELVGMGVQLLCLEDLAAALSLPLARLKPWAPILVFSFYEADSFTTPQRVNPNTASVEQLQQIPLLTPAESEAIIINRQQQGAFRNLANLQQRLGFDAPRTAQLMHYLQF